MWWSPDYWIIARRRRFRDLRLPEPGQAAEFSDAAEPLHAVAVQLTRLSERLASTRDALLPLLMSGKVRAQLNEPANQPANDGEL